MRIQAAAKGDVAGWAALRHALWPHARLPELIQEAEQLLNRNGDTINLVARDNKGGLAGFAEASLRPYVNGCDTSPVAFIEGLYVVPQWRGQGVARDLCGAIESWAREKGCTEIASDVLLENAPSQKMHEAIGFTETERVIYYRKPLG